MKVLSVLRSWGAIRCMCCSSWVWFCVFLCVYLFMNLYFSSRQGLSGEQSLTKLEPAGLTFCQLCVCIWRNIVMTTAWPQMEWKFEQKPLSEGSTSLEVNLKHFIILIVFKEKKKMMQARLERLLKYMKKCLIQRRKNKHTLVTSCFLENGWSWVVFKAVVKTSGNIGLWPHYISISVFLICAVWKTFEWFLKNCETCTFHTFHCCKSALYSIRLVAVVKTY